MKTITIASLKGGCSKTNTCFNLAGMLAKKRYKVLCVDCDPQANLTNDMDFGETIEDYDHLGTILENLFSNKDISPSHIVIKKPLECMPTVDLLPSHIYLTSSEMQIISRAAREFILKKYIDKHKQFFEKYDYIIFDTAPNLSIINQNALVISDHIILVSDMGINSLKGCIKFIEEWSNISSDLSIDNNIVGLLLNKYDSRTNLSKEVVEYVRDNEILKDLSFDVIIPENIKLKETEMMHTPISYYDTKCKGYEAYEEFIKELTTKEIL